MAAVLGLDDGALRTAVAAAVARGAGRVQLANFNQPGQIVISGDEAAVRVAGELALEAGAKRVIPLNVERRVALGTDGTGAGRVRQTRHATRRC